MHDVVCDVLDKLSNPLIEQIDFWIHSNPNEPEYLLQAFSKPVGWTVAEPFDQMTFDFGGRDKNFIGIIDHFDLFFGHVEACNFAEEMGKQVREMAAGRIQLFLDQLADDRQRKFNFEREVTIQYAMGIS